MIFPATINIFEKAARKAGKILARDFGEIENLQIQSKSVGDFVTSADLKVEQSLLETLRYYYPNANFITEESGVIKGEGETIVIDPIDGTSNFIHGIPHVGIVIGKVVDDKITDGIIFNPILNEFYWASEGKGAWCNNKRIRVSKRQDFSSCLIGTGCPFGSRIYTNYYKELDNISKLTAGVRRLGAASIDLAYVASGRIDGFWEKDLNLWDVVSGVLLVTEAGGRLSEPNGDQWKINSKDILVSNTLIHKELIKNLTLL
jgi:myo-inositol-1(or 4)-monophosphatase